MTNCDFLLKLLPILTPTFYTLRDEDTNEFVFLRAGEELKHISNKNIDKTQLEAFINHFHIFDKINVNKKDDVIEVGKAVSRNLLNALTYNFPKKKFIVFLDVNVKDSTTIRFHQLWSGEPPYFDINQFQNTGVELFEFRTQ
jgi:hypothetical protein